MNEQSSLKACPAGHDAAHLDTNGFGISWVNCTECYWSTGHYPSESEAITAWNTRKGDGGRDAA